MSNALVWDLVLRIGKVPAAWPGSKVSRGIVGRRLSCCQLSTFAER